MPGATLVKAIFDYSRKHTDELSFRKGDVIIVSQQVDGGWWEGVLNGAVGWFPSNYVSPVQTSDNGRFSTSDSHLHAFQNEIIQHILEGEVRQVNELNQLYSQIIVNLEPFYHLPFINKLSRMRDLIRQATAMHQNVAYSLNQMRQSSEAKRVGKLFLEMAPTVNSIGCDYSKIHLYVIIGMEKYCDAISRHLSGKCGITFQLDRCKQQLSVVFDRLGRYPLLLKEMERYLEVPHPDREDIRQAIHVYGEITERCAILRKFKEYDIDILLSTINGWQGKSIEKLGDPILTLHVLLLKIDYDLGDNKGGRVEEHDIWPTITNTRLSVIIIFPSAVLLLARTKKQGIYEFTTKIPVNRLKVISCRDNERYLDLIVSSTPTTEVDCRQPSRVSLDCTDENARDLLVSTLNDLIQYQTQLDRASLVEPNASFSSAITGDVAGREGQSDKAKQAGCGGQTPPLSPNKSGRSDDKVQHCAAPTMSGDKLAPGAAPKDTGNQQPPATGSPDGFATEAAKKESVGPSASQARLADHEEHLLPHRIQTGALVRWPGQAASGDCGRVEDGTELPVNALRCLRLDGPNDVFPTSSRGGDGRPLVPMASQDRAPSGEHLHTVSPPGDARPGSPRSTGIDHPASGRELRRKRSDRQKSSINPDEVLRSVGRFQENERRNADATKILQVVEAYCASAWSQHGFHVGDRNHGSFCVPLSPTESRTLRQQLISTQPHRGDKAEQLAKRPLSERLPGDSSGCQKPGPTPSNAPSRSSLVSSASAIVRQVAKRSGSKSKGDSAPSASPFGQAAARAQTPTGAYLAGTSRLMTSSTPQSSAEPGTQALLPPPVILPTRGGRRRP